MTGFQHTPVLLTEVIEALALPPDARVVDCTFGGGGHTEAALAAGANVLGLDRDPEAIRHGADAVRRYKGRLTLDHAPFSDLRGALVRRGWTAVDAVMADLGVSSHQLDQPARGFSFRHSGPVDFRMDPTSGVPLSAWLETVDEATLAGVLREHGDVSQARRVAAAILAGRPFRDTVALADTIARALGGRTRRTHPATTAFQALRIALNREMDELDTLLRTLPDVLVPGGRLAILTFHSGEDARVKATLRAGSVSALPRDAYGHPVGNAVWSQLRDRSPATSDPNPRARSARLRTATRSPWTPL